MMTSSRAALTPPRAVARLRTYTAVTVASVWFLVIVGGVVRVTESGLGCPDWPFCTGTGLPNPTAESIIEWSHRVVVGWVSLLAAAVLILTLRFLRHRRDILWPAAVAVVLLPIQAILGWAAIEFDLAGQMVSVHFMTGMFFLAANAIALAAAWRPVDDGGRVLPTPGISRSFTVWTWIGMIVGFDVVLLGTTVMATGAWGACGTDWPACNGGFAPGGALAVIQVSHRMFAYALAIVAVVLAVLTVRGRGPRVLGVLPLIGVLIQIGFGVWIVASGTSFTLYRIASGAHVAGAGFVWGTLVVLVAACELSRSRAAEANSALADTPGADSPAPAETPPPAPAETPPPAAP